MGHYLTYARMRETINEMELLDKKMVHVRRIQKMVAMAIEKRLQPGYEPPNNVTDAQLAEWRRQISEIALKNTKKKNASALHLRDKALIITASLDIHE